MISAATILGIIDKLLAIQLELQKADPVGAAARIEKVLDRIDFLFGWIDKVKDAITIHTDVTVTKDQTT